MSLNGSSRANLKRQRIMIITTDESLIDQFEKSNNGELFKQILLPSESNNGEMSDKQNKVSSSHQKTKIKNNCLICVICGSSANGYNFGAIACESCKAFFRRNARKERINFHCDDKGDCKITSETRRDCSACRLAKCFNSGMQCDRLLTVEQKQEKRQKIEENKKLALNSTSKTNEEEVELSSSTFSDDLFTSIDTNILLTDFTDLFPPPLQQTLLNSEDFQRIETISHSYQNRIEFAARDGLPWDPSMYTITFLQVLNSHSVQVMRLLSFFKQIPEFNQLNVDDKVTLIKSNLMTILGINCVLSYKIETHEFIESDSDVPSNIQFYPILHGYQMCMKARKIFISFLNIAKCDRKIIELTLIILILTKGFSITNHHDHQIPNDNISVYRAQNYYTELLWKYMQTIHGYEKAIQLFNQLIIDIISWQTIDEQMRNNILRTLSPEDTNQLLPIMKSILRIY